MYIHPHRRRESGSESDSFGRAAGARAIYIPVAQDRAHSLAMTSVCVSWYMYYRCIAICSIYTGVCIVHVPRAHSLAMTFVRVSWYMYYMCIAVCSIHTGICIVHIKRTVISFIQIPVAYDHAHSLAMTSGWWQSKAVSQNTFETSWTRRWYVDTLRKRHEKLQYIGEGRQKRQIVGRRDTNHLQKRHHRLLKRHYPTKYT